MIWYPYTIQKGSSTPPKIQRASREFLYDSSGNSYIDAISSWWTSIHGHNHPKIMSAIKAQLDCLDHVLLAGFSHDSAEKLGETLIWFTGDNFHRVFYSDNGSCGVEIAMKIAFQYFQNAGMNEKKEIIHFSLSYHGDTIGAMSVGGRSHYNENFSTLFFKSKEFTSPDCHNCPLNKIPSLCKTECLNELENYTREFGKKISSIIIEPVIQGANGMIFYDGKVLRRLREICDKEEILLVYDEVFTGFGKTGEKFAFEYAKAIPDILVLAKGLSGGTLPIAATLVNRKVYDGFDSTELKKAFLHGHTMTGNPSACAASIASIEIFENEKSLEKVRALESKMAEYSKKLQSEFGEDFLKTRCLGAVCAMDVNVTKTGYMGIVSETVKSKCIDKGVVIRPLGNVVYVTPPYNIGDDSLDRVFEAIRYAFTFLR
ncbi:MAG: adenosylmethionine--8-amino-7-oxononanoate transaminase [Leptospiraceae bacterium]|nr:adenosylmethionine--8-amino-7-oxononanoate transaminase [Leptospiraceae bacterium]